MITNDLHPTANSIKPLLRISRPRTLAAGNVLPLGPDIYGIAWGGPTMRTRFLP